MFFQPTTHISFEANLTSQEGDGFEMLEELIGDKQRTESELASLFAEELGNLASEHLHSSKDAYLNAISVEDGVVTLDTSDFIVKMVEEGTPSFDMKPGYLDKPSVKVNKQGKKYAVIPVSKYKRGRYNWRDRETGKFSKGSNPGGEVEFRIVSENSDPNSWIHPGHEGFHFIHNTLQAFDDKIDQLVDKKINIVLNKL